MKKLTAKSRIANAALDCFIEKGVVETNFKDIATKADVHQPLIKYHFKSFGDLFEAVIGLLLEDLKAESINAIHQHSEDPLSALLDYAETPIDWSIKKPQFTPVWTFFYHMASYSEPFRILNDSIRKGGRDRITLLLFQIAEAYNLTLRPGVTTKDLAYAVHAQITGDLIMALTESQDLEKAKLLCRKGVELKVKGAYLGF